MARIRDYVVASALALKLLTGSPVYSDEKHVEQPETVRSLEELREEYVRTTNEIFKRGIKNNQENERDYNELLDDHEEDLKEDVEYEEKSNKRKKARIARTKDRRIFRPKVRKFRTRGSKDFNTYLDILIDENSYEDAFNALVDADLSKNKRISKEEGNQYTNYIRWKNKDAKKNQDVTYSEWMDLQEIAKFNISKAGKDFEKHLRELEQKESKLIRSLATTAVLNTLRNTDSSLDFEVSADEASNWLAYIQDGGSANESNSHYTKWSDKKAEEAQEAKEKAKKETESEDDVEFDVSDILPELVIEDKKKKEDEEEMPDLEIPLDVIKEDEEEIKVEDVKEE